MSRSSGRQAARASAVYTIKTAISSLARLAWDLHIDTFLFGIGRTHFNAFIHTPKLEWPVSAARFSPFPWAKDIFQLQYFVWVSLHGAPWARPCSLIQPPLGLNGRRVHFNVSKQELRQLRIPCLFRDLHFRFKFESPRRFLRGPLQFPQWLWPLLAVYMTLLPGFQAALLIV